jgi:RNA dependent RNA polymerase
MPGDVRMLLAINVPELRELHNTLVFSQKGDRPEPSKMSGSDLDGDQYAVTWDNRLFLNEWNNCKVTQDSATTTTHQKGSSLLKISFSDAKRASSILYKTNSEPLEYQRESQHAPVQWQGNTSSKLIDHFFEYNALDNLGLIAMRWQDFAARYGASCKQCVELAEKHSIAV